jgi:TusA-related sulfurtransferase
MTEPRIDEKLDLSNVACPNNFVRALIRLGGMPDGQVLEIIIDDGEPCRNVPPAILEEGHTILLTERFDANRWRLLIQKVG